VVGGALAKLPRFAGFASSGNYALAQIVSDRTLPNNSRAQRRTISESFLEGLKREVLFPKL
jgi:hypothetical protein